LNPKRPDYFYKLTADELGVSEDLVRSAVELYWKEVRKSITELKHHAIHVKGLGTFLAKPWKLKEMKEKYVFQMSLNDGSTFRKMAIKADMDARILKIEKLEADIEKDKLRKQSIKDKRHDKINSANLEEQGSNTGRSLEQNIQEGSSGGSISKENEDM
jgi:hypothetical protein